MGPLAIGIALMSVALPSLNWLFWLGFAISICSSFATAKLFWRHIKKFSLPAVYVWLLVIAESGVPIALVLYAHAIYSPFHLSDEQKRLFAAAAIAPEGGDHWVIINVSGLCPDCQRFQYEIRDILNGLPGWKTGVGQMLGAAATITGVEIWVRDRAHQPEACLVIEKAFQRANIEFKVLERPPSAPSSQFAQLPHYEVEINTGPV
jgi:hypothetical protein